VEKLDERPLVDISHGLDIANPVVQILIRSRSYGSYYDSLYCTALFCDLIRIRKIPIINASGCDLFSRYSLIRYIHGVEIILDEPTVARLQGFEPLEATLKKALTYTDERVAFELTKTTRSLKNFTGKLRFKLQDSWGQEKYDAVIAEMEAKKAQLTAERKKCLLFKDAAGLWTYSGLAHRLARAGNAVVNRRYALPEAELIPYANDPRFKDRFYQVEAQEALLAAAGEGPVGIELPTGAGKSTVIRNLLHSLALGAVVMAPSTSIALQLFDDLTYYFGKRYVGLYGDGKKQYDKLFVVAIDDSLSKVEEGSPAWDAFRTKSVFIADESHLTPATSLQKVCFGLLKYAPYRFFVSATQMRNDGLDMVLDGITGRIVYRKTARELIDAGFLAKPVFKMVNVLSYSRIRSEDPNRMTREHLYYNPIVNRVAGDLANKFVEQMRRPVVILVEELEQFRELLPHLRGRVKFAHAPLDKAKKELVPEAFWADKHTDLVKAFNAGALDVLVGTSCIATGTDIQVAEAGIYLMGGKSEIKLKQGVGRETRGGFAGTVMNPWTGTQKLNCIHVDFDVRPFGEDAEGFSPHRHADMRRAVYKSIYDPASEIDYTHLK
jgi:superfamily II DNA or RNA helicase